jgi:hypothetical protein
VWSVNGNLKYDSFGMEVDDSQSIPAPWGGDVFKATTTSPNPNPTPQPVTKVPKQLKVTATRKTAKPKKPEPKPTAAPKLGTVRPKKKVAASVKTVVDKPTTTPVVISQPTISPLVDISDLDNLPLQACVELSHQLLTSTSSPHMGGLPAGCPENHNSIRGRIWQHALGGRRG